MNYHVGMPRYARIDFPGAVHHVYARGIEKRDVFLDEEDRYELRRRILKNMEKFDSSCLAWAFLPNHFHIVFHSRKGNLPDFMRCVLTGYANYFNRKYERAGHLFQNRYKSVLVGSIRYLLEVIRYVHLNPVRAGIVPSLELLSGYPWTSHYEILKSGHFPWEEFPEVGNFFEAGGKTDQFPSYLGFLAEGVYEDRTEGRMDGFEAFHSALSASEDDLRKLPEKESMETEFQEIVSRCSEEFGAIPDRIFDRRRDPDSVNARKKILRTCVMEKGMELKSVCEWLGITRSGGAYLLRGG